MCAAQEINALCIRSLDNTNAFQDLKSAVSCVFSLMPQGDFQTKYFPGLDFTVWLHVEKHLGVRGTDVSKSPETFSDAGFFLPYKTCNLQGNTLVT